jgi:pSer/pThr/pTyr-binding forkhead associated (FHA) protein
LDDVRAELDADNRYIVYEEEGEPVVVELPSGWTRIGRSGAADLRLDDATVSRRHALIVRTPEDELRALDDRSLNGLFVNGERVDWTPLSDGDELEIGRYRLYVLGA